MREQLRSGCAAPGTASARELPRTLYQMRLKYIASINDEVLPETTDPARELAYVDISSVHATAGIIKRESVTFDTAPSRARRIVRDGDTIVSTVRTYLRAIAAIQRPAENLVVSTGFAVVRPRRCDPRYLSYALRAREFVEAVVARSNGVSYPAITSTELKDIPIAVPGNREQKEIGRYLDRTCARIDELIAKKIALKDKLREERTATISHTVTGALPPDEPAAARLLRRSNARCTGVASLGSVPEHWQVVRLRRVLRRLDQGWSPVAENAPADEAAVGVLKISAVRRGQFLPSENKRLEDVPEDVVAIAPQRGDLLLSRANTPDRVGDVCIVRDAHPKRIIPDLLFRLSFRDAILPDFACYFLLSRSGRAQIEADARGSNGSMVKLGQDQVRSWYIPVPPLDEQAAIVECLDGETSRIDHLINTIETAILRLTEYRSAVITAAVTGKIDVHGFSPEQQPMYATPSAELTVTR